MSRPLGLKIVPPCTLLLLSATLRLLISYFLKPEIKILYDEMEDILLEYGANPHARTSAQLSALHQAARCGSLTCAELLVSRGAAVDAGMDSIVSFIHVLNLDFRVCERLDSFTSCMCCRTPRSCFSSH